MRILECCPKGHVGRGILIDSEVDDAGYEVGLKFKCELCGEVWWEEGLPANRENEEDWLEEDEPEEY